MKYTGERPDFTTGIDGSRIRYKSVLPYCIDKVVMDYGCGFGLGSYFLSHFATQVFGYDVNAEVIEHGNAFFGNPKNNLMLTSDLVELQKTRKIDVITMVEVIEHIEPHKLDSFLNSLVYCFPKASLICTTPDGYLFPYRPNTVKDRVGFHTWHYTAEELTSIFSKHFSFVDITGCARDPRIDKWTSYLVYASNEVPWSDKWLEVAKP